MGDFALLESQKLISCKIWVIEKSWNFHTVKFMSPKATWLFSSSNSKHALFAPKLATLLKLFPDLSYPGITVGTKQTVAGFWVSRIDYFKAKNFRSSDLYLQNSIAPFLPYTLYWINGFLSWYTVFHLTFSKKKKKMLGNENVHFATYKTYLNIFFSQQKFLRFWMEHLVWQKHHLLSAKVHY